MHTGITQDAQRKAILLHLSGKDVKNIYRTLNDSEDKFNDIVKNYFQPEKELLLKGMFLSKPSKLKAKILSTVSLIYVF